MRGSLRKVGGMRCPPKFKFIKKSIQSMGG